MLTKRYFFGLILAIMSHVTDLATKKTILEARFVIIKAIRAWFDQAGFTEVDAPILLRLPGQEPYLSPMRLNVHNERGEEVTGYLHTSPEYALKKMLSAGFDKIFSLGKVFRDYESFGGTHNPEFTMIEWYRANSDFYALMDDVENLFWFTIEENGKGKMKDKRWKITLPSKNPSSFIFQRIHMRDLWKEYVEINLDEYLTREKMLVLCKARGFNPNENESYEDLFYRIFLNEIEPKLANRGGVIVHHYPLPMASLSRPSEKEIGYAERVEVYVNGLEIANGFSELTDAVEQRRRLEEEQKRRQELGKDVFPIDEDFIEAVGLMPPSAGIALGVDRLVQIITGCQNIDDVIPLPASLLFEK